jgi:hypothetical protein
MRATVRRFGLGCLLAGALALLAVGPAALAQRRGGGRGSGTIVFVTRRPPRDFVGDVRGWAHSVHAVSYNEDTAAHVWRVSFMAFMPRPPNAAEVVLTWFHVERGGVGRYVSNEPIALADPTQRVLFHTTSLRRAPGEFEPLEHYEAVLSVNDARGARELARGQIELIGQLERHSGVVDFTHGPPTAR